jgi:hypothetical protein
MARDPLPEDLQRFVLTSVPSVPFVEAMLIYGAAGGEPVPVETVASRLYVPPRTANEIVEQLVGAGVIAPAGNGHRFAPASPELAGRLQQLTQFYRSNLVGVTDLIHSRSRRAAQQFADAFKLRKDT